MTHLEDHSLTAHPRYGRSYNLHRQSYYMNVIKKMRGYELQLPVRKVVQADDVA